MCHNDFQKNSELARSTEQRVKISKNRFIFGRENCFSVNLFQIIK